MLKGEVSIRNGSVLLVGSGGSGKTLVLASILEEPAPVMRESTPCAKAPVRTVAHCKAEVSDDHFVRIDDDQYSNMLIVSAEHLPKPSTEIISRTQEQTEIVKKSVATSSSTGNKTSEPDIPLTKVDVVQSEHSWCVRRAMKKEYLGRMQEGRLNKKLSLNNKEIIDFRDTGGQSMFHETLPVFIHNTMFGIVTVKLNERLDSYPKIEYYIKGKRVGEPFDSTFTHQETFRHCMRVIQSTCNHSTTPKIAFVGTHKDLEKDCPTEDKKMKEEKLRNIIPPAMEDSIVTFGESLLLAVNAKMPGEGDKKAMATLRRKITEELRKLKPSRIPLRYVPLEMALRRLAKDQGKSVLSKDECFKIALTYDFTRESFEAALKYLHGLKLIFYYEEVLPDLVFINAQALLDKITELVVHRLELHAKSGRRFLGALKKFVKCGIVTMEILSEFESHYIPNVFTRKELIILFKYLRIMAEIGNGEYLMPCLLKKIEGLPRLMPGMSTLVVPALLFYFGRDGPLLGVYCFLLSTLITEFSWILLEENGYPVQVSRNQATFILPGKNPGAVTITDSFSTFFHVAIEPGEGASAEEAREIYMDVCPTIRETILTAIRKASQKLNYANSLPEVTFPCLRHEATTIHPATISRTGLLTCTENPKICGKMTELHHLWFGNKESTQGLSTYDSRSTVASPPVTDATVCTPAAVVVSTTMPTQDGQASSSTNSLESQHTGCLGINDLSVVVKALWEARVEWYNIGVDLKISPDTLDEIQVDHRDTKSCFREMLKVWLRRTQPLPSWSELAEALKSPMVGREDLADKLPQN